MRLVGGEQRPGIECLGSLRVGFLTYRRANITRSTLISTDFLQEWLILLRDELALLLHEATSEARQ